MSFSDLGLAPELLRAIADQGYTEATPVQAKAIPAILDGQDVMAAAQTGTGKTAGFTLPMLQRLKEFANTSVSPARHPVRALILTPTRELAAQVQDSVRTYGKYIALRSAVVYGGVHIDPQIAELRAGVEILVATPGRLLDHLGQKTVNLSQVQFLVLDEADRMLDMGFLPDIKRIISVLPVKRQSLLFSATYSDDIRGLAKQFLIDPISIEVARRNSATETVTHLVYKVESAAKRDLLTHLIKSRDMRQVLVFCNTKIGANRLAYKLDKDGVGAAAIHSDRTQGERMLALAEFKEGKTKVLVATDIAARGLDIEQLPFVINFDLPGSPEDYVHRIGRTGRAGMTGEAISLVSDQELDDLAAIEKLLKLKLPVQDAGRFERERASVPAQAGARRRERGAAPRHDDHRRSERERRPSAASTDPLFSKPYTPSSPQTPLVQPAASTRGGPKKQIAALLLPPVPAEKQDA
ncbi:MAG TPA: DEAD/DEAH box helicase [Burkholderiales bacterium]|nr:DEAD/DEAH box helicase [Burkholderiales bacterium]